MYTYCVPENATTMSLWSPCGGVLAHSRPPPGMTEDLGQTLGETNRHTHSSLYRVAPQLKDCSRGSICPGVSDFQNVFKCLQQVSHVVTYRSKSTGTLIFVIRKIFLRVPQGEVSPQKWNLTVMSYMLWVLFGLA